MGRDDRHLCPSAQPDPQGSALFGVVGGGPDDEGLVAYLREPQAVTPGLLALAGPLKPTTVFRFAAPCVESACAHFDGAACGLATRVVELLPAVVEVLPPCAIRRDCRWWRQEGRAACLRCPAIATEPPDASDALRRAAAPAGPTSSPP